MTVWRSPAVTTRAAIVLKALKRLERATIPQLVDETGMQNYLIRHALKTLGRDGESHIQVYEPYRGTDGQERLTAVYVPGKGVDAEFTHYERLDYEGTMHLQAIYATWHQERGMQRDGPEEQQCPA